VPKWHHDTHRNDNLLNDNRHNNTKHEPYLIDTRLLVAVMPSYAVFIVMQSVVIFKVRSLCHYADCAYAECHYTEYCYSECSFAECCYTEYYFAECPFSEHC
jgi:hypothetical protein